MKHLLILSGMLVVLWPLTSAQGAEDGSASRIAEEVRHQIVTLPGYRVFDFLAYRIDGSKVKLFGHVTRLALKGAAEEAVKSIAGVTGVSNEIEVLRPSPTDEIIRFAVYQAIYSRESLQKYQLGAVAPIHIIVENGNVTLEGVVNSAGDKDLAGLAAMGVSGVLKLVNNLSALPDGSGIMARV
jgi:osmotically-inducible protein OsmY